MHAQLSISCLGHEIPARACCCHASGYLSHCGTLMPAATVTEPLIMDKRLEMQLQKSVCSCTRVLYWRTNHHWQSLHVCRCGSCQVVVCFSACAYMHVFRTEGIESGCVGCAVRMYVQRQLACCLGSVLWFARESFHAAVSPFHSPVGSHTSIMMNL